MEKSTALLLHPGRRSGISLRRRPRLPSIRLGGSKRPRRVVAVVGLLKKIRMRWLRLQYLCMLRKIRQCYSNLVKDLSEASATIEAFQNRVLIEASFGVPVMGLTFSAPDRPRTLAM